MAIVNRSKDISEQKEVIRRVIGPALSAGGTFLVGVAAGSSYLIGSIPYQSLAKALMAVCTNLGNSLALVFNVQRFVPGLGQTVIAGVFGSLALQNFSTSGIQSVSLLAPGSTLLSLLAGDQLWMSPIGASGTADTVTVDLVISAVNDIKQIYGSST